MVASGGRIPWWLRRLTPDDYCASVLDVDPRELTAKGIRGVILDLDNTLAPWGRGKPAPELQGWIAEARAAGLACHIVSNDHGPRVRYFTQVLGIEGTPRAAKPAGRAFRRAMHEMRTLPSETVVIGDQIFTDVLGGKHQGCHTILVVPVSDEEMGWTRLVRRLERAVLRRLQVSGLLPARPRRRGDGS